MFVIGDENGCKINFFLERKRVVKDLMRKNPETRFLFVTPDQVASEQFTNILLSLFKNDKLAFFAVDEGELI